MIEALEVVQGTLTRLGVRHWDVYAQRVKECDLQLRGYDIETVRYPIENFGFAVRVVDKREGEVGLGIAPGNSLTAKVVERAAKLALGSAKTTKFKGYELPGPAVFPKVDVADPKILKDAYGLVIDRGEQLVSLLRRHKNVEPTFGKVRSYELETAIVNSRGLEAKKVETLFYVEVAIKSSSGGKLAEFWPRGHKRRADDFNLERDVPLWVKLAQDGLRAKLPKTKETTLIMSPDMVSETVEPVVGFHASGAALSKKQSRFEKGKRVAGENVTILDDGLYKYGLGSSPFDDEGNPQRTTTLIQNGVCEGFIYDNLYGYMLKHPSTGNGVKGSLETVDLSYSMPISNQPTNITIQADGMTFDELVEDVKDGIMVHQFSWMSPDNLTGSFGSEIRNGYLIKDGVVTQPVKGGAVSGFVLDTADEKGKVVPGLLSKVSGATKEREIAKHCIAPYMRFEKVQVAGK